MPWRSRRWFGVPIALVYSYTPLNHHLPEARLQFRASPLTISIVIDPRMPGHGACSNAPRARESPLDKSSIIPYKWVKDKDMRTFSFLLTDGFRVDVKASTPKVAYNKLLPYWSSSITKQYLDYVKDSSIYGWKSL